MSEGKFDITEFFESDINEILEARKRSFSIHHTKDIRTAGDEIEETVRRVLASRLPSIYHVGHGHLVGPDGTTSPQLDVIISDSRTNTVLFRAKNGAEYLPFGAAGVIGEVKSTYQKSKKYIESFIETLTNMGTISPEIPESSNTNALTFMLFVNSGDFKIEDVEKIYETTSDNNLPHLLYFLDKGVIYNAGHYSDSETGVNLHNTNVITSNWERELRGTHDWIFRQFGKEGSRNVANYAFFYSTISYYISIFTTYSRYNLMMFSADLIAYETPGNNIVKVIRKGIYPEKQSQVENNL